MVSGLLRRGDGRLGTRTIDGELAQGTAGPGLNVVLLHVGLHGQHDQQDASRLPDLGPVPRCMRT